MAAKLMSDEHRNKLKQFRVQIVEFMNIESAIDHIAAAGILQNAEIDVIESKPTRAKKVQCFLDSLQLRPDHDFLKFVNILKKTNQEALAALLDESIDGTPEQSAPASSAGPPQMGLMSAKHRERLNVKRSELEQCLNLGQLTGDLLAQRVITPEDKEEIHARQTRVQKADKFLDLLAQKTDRAFYAFVAVLKEKGSENEAYGYMAQQLQDP